jgi:hypothetical protein
MKKLIGERDNEKSCSLSWKENEEEEEKWDDRW